MSEARSRRALLLGSLGAAAALAAKPFSALATITGPQDGMVMHVGGHYVQDRSLALTAWSERDVLSLSADTGAALTTAGRVVMARNSGVAILPAGETLVQLDLLLPTSKHSIAFACVNGTANTSVKSVEVTFGVASPGLNIYVTRACPHPVEIAWLVLG